ncbi:MAG: ATP-dependent helicase HrpB [Spirochaetales bacterium]|uniref:ATP-dependent helicase HrpB n=1 Tax=Candidatus Thalassospirochaeta sargassi TaxID=3119039 RepID=A0AAJ1IJB3_9SPIO|nr:ATP-dependent helicase HrpB [Spirochaetales bacterium]
MPDVMSALPDYPVKSSFAGIKKVLSNSGLAAIEAPTGSGKTTLLPLMLLKAGLSQKKILLTQPRRLAAKTVAQRMAQLDCTEVGETVGYRVKGESKLGSNTKIIAATEGTALAMMQHDPFMSDYDWVIIDEFHERHIETDLLLTFVRDLRKSLGPKEAPGIILMTATWQGQPVEALPEFSFHRIEGRLFPVKNICCPPGITENLPGRLNWGVKEAAEQTDGRILVFLPGRREIEAARKQFSTGRARFHISILHGGMELSEQQNVLNYQGSQRQLILATAVAETSLTVEGVTAVVDSGLERLPVFQPRLGITRLDTRRVSRATADQRAGRAGRLGPGLCLKLWTEAENHRLTDRWDPEILSGDLAAARLQTALWGSSEPAWITPPPPGLWLQAEELLKRLNALDGEGRITAEGKAIAALPLPPRLAHMVYTAGRRTQAALAAAILTEGHRFKLSGSFSRRMEAARSGAEFAGIRKQASEIERRIMGASNRDRAVLSLGELLSLAYPDRIGRKTASGLFELVTGAPLRCENCNFEWAVFPEISGTGNRIFAETGEELDLGKIRNIHPSLFSTLRRVSYNPDSFKFSVQRSELIGKLELKKLPSEKADKSERLKTVKDMVEKKGIDSLPLNKAGRLLLTRLRTAENAGIIGLPSGKPEVLESEIEDWLGPWLDNDLTASAVAEALYARLDWQQQKRLEKLFPQGIKLSEGLEKKIDYENADVPLIRGRMQEFYGQTAPFSIAEGLIPVAVELLSPAMRPLQTTSNLGEFWTGSYLQIRAEMRGRYPKHYWPENPGSAEPSLATGKKRPE